MQTTETLASLRATEHNRLLGITARHLLFDWRAAKRIMEATWKLAESILHQHDPANGSLLSFVCCIRDRLTYDYAKANGLFPPKAGRAEITKRINTLPPMLREAMHGWLARRPIDAATGVRVRVGLRLLGRAAA